MLINYEILDPTIKLRFISASKKNIPMNNQEEAIRLSKKIDDILKIKRGILKLVFFDGKTIEVRLFQKQTTLNKDEFHCLLKTYTNDIKTLTEYDIYSIRKID